MKNTPDSCLSGFRHYSPIMIQESNLPLLYNEKQPCVNDYGLGLEEARNYFLSWINRHKESSYLYLDYLDDRLDRFRFKHNLYEIDDGFVLPLVLIFIQAIIEALSWVCHLIQDKRPRSPFVYNSVCESFFQALQDWAKTYVDSDCYNWDKWAREQLMKQYREAQFIFDSNNEYCHQFVLLLAQTVNSVECHHLWCGSPLWPYEHWEIICKGKKWENRYLVVDKDKGPYFDEDSLFRFDRYEEKSNYWIKSNRPKVALESLHFIDVERNGEKLMAVLNDFCSPNYYKKFRAKKKAARNSLAASNRSM